jgi:hypothetical protein
MLGFVASNFISKYILQSHIDVITCIIEEWNNSWNPIWKNGPSYNCEVIKIDYGFFKNQDLALFKDIRFMMTNLTPSNIGR